MTVLHLQSSLCSLYHQKHYGNGHRLDSGKVVAEIPGPGTRKDRGDGMRILLIDDDPDIYALVKVAFRAEAAELSWAVSGLQGLQLFEQEQPDLVLCDIGLPDVDGVHLAHALNDRSPETPLIFLTGHTSEMDLKDARMTGARDYIGKPFEIRNLVERVKAVMYPMEQGTQPPLL